MSRFLVFAGDTYYPSGGWDDYRMATDTYEDAKQHVLNMLGKQEFDWAHVVDTTTLKIVLNSSTSVRCRLADNKALEKHLVIHSVSWDSQGNFSTETVSTRIL